MEETISLNYKTKINHLYIEKAFHGLFVNNTAMHPTTHFQYFISFAFFSSHVGMAVCILQLKTITLTFIFFLIVLHFVSICCLPLDKCNNPFQPKGGLVHILMGGTIAVGRQQIITVGSSHPPSLGYGQLSSQSQSSGYEQAAEAYESKKQKKNPATVPRKTYPSAKLMPLLTVC